MARIQILELPTDVVGEYAKTPFAIVIDQAKGIDEALAGNFAESIGAVGAVVSEGVLEVTHPKYL